MKKKHWIIIVIIVIIAITGTGAARRLQVRVLDLERGVTTLQSDTGEALGIIKDVLATGANDVYVIKTPDNKEILLPAIKDCILDIALDKKTMTVHVLDGLMP